MGRWKVNEFQHLSTTESVFKLRWSQLRSWPQKGLGYAERRLASQVMNRSISHVLLVYTYSWVISNIFLGYMFITHWVAGTHMLSLGTHDFPLPNQLNGRPHAKGLSLGPPTAEFILSAQDLLRSVDDPLRQSSSSSPLHRTSCQASPNCTSWLRMVTCRNFSDKSCSLRVAGYIIQIQIQIHGNIVQIHVQIQTHLQ